ncbi:MAG: hypothetical protein ACRCVG_01210 [Methanobacteriaceae archaeon]
MSNNLGFFAFALLITFLPVLFSRLSLASPAMFPPSRATSLLSWKP